MNVETHTKLRFLCLAGGGNRRRSWASQGDVYPGRSVRGHMNNSWTIPGPYKSSNLNSQSSIEDTWKRKKIIQKKKKKKIKVLDKEGHYQTQWYNFTLSPGLLREKRNWKFVSHAPMQSRPIFDKRA